MCDPASGLLDDEGLLSARDAHCAPIHVPSNGQGAEARAISPDLPSRIGDYAAFMDERVRAHIRRNGLQVISYRHLKALMA